MEEKLSEAGKALQKYSRAFNQDNDMKPSDFQEKAENILAEVGYTEYQNGGMYRKVYADKRDTVVNDLRVEP